MPTEECDNCGEVLSPETRTVCETCGMTLCPICYYHQHADSPDMQRVAHQVIAYLLYEQIERFGIENTDLSRRIARAAPEGQGALLLAIRALADGHEHTGQVEGDRAD